MNHENGPVLVLDDEKNIVTVLVALLGKRGFYAEGFTEPAEALKAVRNGSFRAIVTDLYMPEMDGMQFLKEVKKINPEIPVVMITAFGTVDSAVDAIKQGAFDYVTKPFEQSEICMVIQKALNSYDLKNLELDSNSFSPCIQGEELKSIRDSISKTAATPSTVLVLGEPGSGRELVADEIVRHSDRSQAPYIKFNCASVSGGQIDVELFGGNKPGRLEMADGGTLFVDQISELPSECQVRLLQFLEHGLIEPAAGNNKLSKKVNVRLIVASDVDLPLRAKEASFNEELFYKLNIVPIHLPPLRDRKDDISNLANYFLDRINKRVGKNIKGLELDCIKEFQNSYWPGNLRQMEQVIERMVLLSNKSTLNAKDIPSDLREEIKTVGISSSAKFRDVIKKRTQNLERELIEKALGETEGNITKTAEALGLSRKGLQLKLKELGIKVNG